MCISILREKKLEDAIQQVYELQSVQEVLKLVESLIVEMERHLEDKREQFQK